MKRFLITRPFGAYHYAVILFLFTTLVLPAVENLPPEADASIVEVIATCQDFDAQLPWRNKRPLVRASLGVVVEGRQIMTIENVVRNQTLVEIRRAKSGVKLEAGVLEADEQLNAALLEPADENARRQLKSVPFAEKGKRDDLVTILKMDESGQFQRGAGRVVETISSPQGLLFKVLTDLSVEKAGTPVFTGDKLAGLVLNYDKGAQSCLVLSAASLKKFQAAANAPPYAGSAAAGLIWEPLLDPAKRKYLGADAAGRNAGVLVVNTVPGSGAAGALQPEDVILEWDGYQLDELGFYADPDFGRILFSYLIAGRRRPGEKAAVTILRQHEKLTREVPLKRLMDRERIVPENTLGAQAEYLAEGGLILRELTGDYLFSFGGDWVMQLNPRLVYYYFNPWEFSRKAGEHIVILARVLPDQINIGYHELRDEIVTAVNGRPIHNLAEVFAALEQDGGLKRISLKGYGVDLVLDENEMPAANRRIAANYRIPSLRYQRDRSNKK